MKIIVQTAEGKVPLMQLIANKEIDPHKTLEQLLDSLESQKFKILSMESKIKRNKKTVETIKETIETIKDYCDENK